jgi:hypothetical protein
MKKSVKVKHKRTNKSLTVEVSGNLKDEAEIKAHIERVLPDHDFVEIVSDEPKPAKK